MNSNDNDKSQLKLKKILEEIYKEGHQANSIQIFDFILNVKNKLMDNIELTKIYK